METTLIRHEARMGKCDARIDKLEIGYSEANGKAKLVATSLALLGWARAHRAAGAFAWSALNPDAPATLRWRGPARCGFP